MRIKQVFVSVFIFIIFLMCLEDKQCGTSSNNLKSTPLFTLHEVFFIFKFNTKFTIKYYSLLNF